MNALPRTAPEAQGASSAGLAAFTDALDALGGTHSAMVLKNGSVIAETWWAPYRAETPHMLYSVSKSFTSTAVGLLVSNGSLSLDDRVIDLLPADAPAEPSENLAALTVRHLLTMTTGHSFDTNALFQRDDYNWARTILAAPVEHVPGARFVYNTGATYLLSAIVQKVSGERLLDFLQSRVLTPLGIMDATWDESPDGINAGGYGLRLRTEEVAAFGQLYLQHGLWNGTQLVPAEWVELATSLVVPSVGEAPDWQAGYGYQFWQSRDGSYRADGAFGQFCVVLDELDAVVVLTGGLLDMKSQLDIVFEHALPALSAPASAATSPAASEPRHFVTPTPAASARQHTEDYFFPTNPLKITSISIVDQVLTVDDHTIPFGTGEWVTGGTYVFRGATEEVAASGGWTDDTHFVIEIRAVQTPFAYIVNLGIEGDTIDLRVELNASFEPRRNWRLVGGIRSGDENTSKK